MLGRLLQNIVGASKNPKDTIDLLTQLAPLLIIAAIWLFGAIAKAVQGGKKGQQPQQPARPQPRQQPDFDDLIRTVRERYRAAKQQAAKAQSVSPPPPVQRPQPPPPVTRPVWSAAKQPPATPMPAMPEPMVASMPPTMELVKPAAPPQAFTEEQTSTPGHEEHLAARAHPLLTELAQEYKQTKGLRKAILHSEILGKPLALREQQTSNY